MRSHVVRVGHRQASDGTTAQAASPRILGSAPRTIREQYLDRRHEQADAVVKTVARLTREHFAVTARSLTTPMTFVDFVVGEMARGYCYLSERYVVAPLNIGPATFPDETHAYIVARS